MAAAAPAAVQVEYLGYFLGKYVGGMKDGKCFMIKTNEDLEQAAQVLVHGRPGGQKRDPVAKLRELLVSKADTSLILVYLIQGTCGGHTLFVPKVEVTDNNTVLRVTVTDDLGAQLYGGMSTMASAVLIFSNPESLPITDVVVTPFPFKVRDQPELKAALEDPDLQQPNSKAASGDKAERRRHLIQQERESQAFKAMCERLPVIRF